MRFSITLIAACASLMASAQQLPDCVQGCIDRVSEQHSCADPEYANGISDCATEACGDDASAAVDYLDSVDCPEASGDATTTEAESTVTTTAEDGSETVTTTDSEGKGSAVTTSPLEATVSASDTTYVTTTGSTTIYADESASSAVSSLESSVESALSSASESASEGMASASSEAEESAKATAGGGGAESTSSDVAVAGATLAPMAGALGMAALLLV